MTTILYGLCLMWALGMFGVAVAIVGQCDSYGGKIVASLILLPVWFVIGLFPAGALHHELGPELTTLLKSEWQCSASHQEVTTTVVTTGKTTVPVVTTTTVCDQYSRGATQ